MLIFKYIVSAKKCINGYCKNKSFYMLYVNTFHTYKKYKEKRSLEISLYDLHIIYI